MFQIVTDSDSINIGTGVAAATPSFTKEGQQFANELKTELEKIKINDNHKNLSVKNQEELTKWYNVEMDNLKKEFKNNFSSKVADVIFTESSHVETENV